MSKFDAQMGLFEIDLQSGAESKTLNNIVSLLKDKEALILKINQNIHHFTKEQVEYLKSLLSLEVSVFKNDNLNKDLVGNSLFFYVARYNLYEGVIRTLKQMDKIDPKQIEVSIGLPNKSLPSRNWLYIQAHTILLGFPLLEIEMYSEGTEITLYDSQGYTNEVEKFLIENYKKQGMEQVEMEFRLEENKQKKEILKCVARGISNYWNISDFDENISYDENVRGKTLSWARVYKKSVDD